MNWTRYDHWGCSLPYIHRWPGQAETKSTGKHLSARKLRAKSRKARARA